MKKIIMFLIYSVLTVVVLIAIAIGSIVLFVNPNQFKPQITELVQKNANLVLTIDGDIEWTFFPWLGIKVQNISVASPNTPTVPVATIKMAQASVLLKSLINKELNVNDIVVENLNISLLKDAKGNTNWQFPQGGKTVKATEGEATLPDAEKNKPVGLVGFYVRSVTIKDANFIYKDAQTNQALALKNLTVQTGEIKINEPISLNLKAQYALFNPKVDGDIELASVVNFNQVQKQLQVRGLQLKNSISIDQKIQLLTAISGAVDVDLDTQLVQLSDLAIEVSGNADKLKIQKLNIEGVVKADLKQGLINVDGLKVKVDGSLDQLAIKDLQLNSSIKVDLTQEIAKIEQLKVLLADLQLTGSVTAEKFKGDQLTFHSTLATNTFNLKVLLNHFKVQLPKFPSTNVLQKASLQLTAKGNLKNIDINPLKLTVDQTTITGSGALALSKVPTIAIALKGDQLALHDYLSKNPDANASGKNQSHPKAKAPANVELIPPLPKTVNVVVDIEWKQLQLDQLQLTQNRVKGSLKNGSATLDQLSTNIYGGTISLNGSLMDAEQPKIGLNGTVKSLDLGKIIPQISLGQYIKSDLLLSKLNQSNKNISVQGLMNTQFKLNTAGRTENQLIANLNGDANFDLTQGKIMNFNYEKLMCQGIAMLNRKQLTSSFNRNDTDFQKLAGKFIMRNGVITNDPLQLLVPGLAVNGNGSVNLNRMTVSYQAQALLTGDRNVSADPACQISDNFKNIAIPVICEGSLDNPASLCRLDTAQLGNIAGQLLEKAAKEKINKELDKQKDKLRDQLGDKLDQEIKKNPKIKGLLKNLL